jgi:hypothetical protein
VTLAALDLEMHQQRQTAVRRFNTAVAACRRLAFAGLEATDEYAAAVAEFEDAREQLEAWERFTPNHGDW